MTYDFDTPVDRSKNFSAKHDERKRVFGREDVIPLWVADMDFRTAQPIIDALTERASQGIYGYTTRPDSYFEAVCQWQKNRNDWDIQPEQCAFNLGVVPALCTAVMEYTDPGDKVIFFTPVYPEFFDCVEKWDRQVVTSPLKEDKELKYVMDFDDFESKLKKESPKMLILCHPHNPVGRVWTRDELIQLGELCLQYNVFVVSDEIHSDLMLWSSRHIPFASIRDDFAQNSITCISATKTFNLAGLQASTTIFYDQKKKNDFIQFWNKMDIHRNNFFSLTAMETAYRYGEEWLDQLRTYLEGSTAYVKHYLDIHIPRLKTYVPQSTYLMWVDCRGLEMEGKELSKFMIEKAGLGLGDGRNFGNGEGFMRMNVACSRLILQQALQQLKNAVNSL